RSGLKLVYGTSSHLRSQQYPCAEHPRSGIEGCEASCYSREIAGWLKAGEFAKSESDDRMCQSSYSRMTFSRAESGLLQNRRIGIVLFVEHQQVDRSRAPLRLWGPLRAQQLGIRRDLL